MRGNPFALACFDWALAVAPVGIYLFIEHAFVDGPHGSSAWYESPEWGISTAFLCLMTVFVLLVDLAKVDGEAYRYQPGRSRLFALGMGLVMMVALVVSGRILARQGEPRSNWIAAQWALLICSSIIFIWLKRLLEQCKED